MSKQNEARLLSLFRGELMGLAMLWVVFFHCFRLTVSLPVLAAVKSTGFCGVDIFLMLSGMGQYVSLEKDGSIASYYRRRLSRVLPAYWLVVGLYGLALRSAERQSLTMVALNLSTLQYWLGTPGGFNWYIPALLVFYLLAPFYVRLLRRCRSGILLTLCAFPLSYLLSEAAAALGAGHLNDFLYRLPAFAVGCLLGRFLREERSAEDRALLWGSLGALGLLMAYIRIKGLFYVSYCYVVAAIAVPLCVLLCLLLRRLPAFVGKFLRLLGTYSLEIYLINVIVTVEIGTLSRLLPLGGYGLYYAAAFALTIPLAVLLHNLLEMLMRRITP